MKTEIRLFLAILLSIIVLVAYQSLFMPKITDTPPSPQSTPDAQPTTQISTEQPVTAPAQPSTGVVSPPIQTENTFQHVLDSNNGIILETDLYSMILSNLSSGVSSFLVPKYKEHFFVNKKFLPTLWKEKSREYTKLKGSSSGNNTVDGFKDMVERLDREDIYERFLKSQGAEKKLQADLYRFKEIGEKLSNKGDNQGIELVSVYSTLGVKPLELLNSSKLANSYVNDTWETAQHDYTDGEKSGRIAELRNMLLIGEDRIDVARKIKTYDSTYYFDLETTYSNPGNVAVELGEQYLNIGPGVGFIQEKGYRTKTSESFVYLFENSVQRFNEQRELTVKPDWVALESKYFTCIVMPFYEVRKILFEEHEQEEFKQVLLALNTHVIEPGETKTFATRVYYGPKKLSDLKKLNNQVARIIDFGFFAIISKPLFDLLNLFHKITRNYGVAILILTVLIKIIFYPLNKNQIKSMQRMKEIQPQLEEIKTKYKSDPKKMNQEYWAAMKKNKANPLGGCLPLLIQIPVFFALYNILINAIEMRHAAFLYIKDLSSADPYYISPILMGASMVIQQKMTPSTIDPAQQRMMTLMPIIFTVIFLNMPSGLVIYWLASNVLSIVQQVVMTRKQDTHAHIKKAKKSGGKKWNR